MAYYRYDPSDSFSEFEAVSNQARKITAGGSLYDSVNVKSVTRLVNRIMFFVTVDF